MNDILYNEVENYQDKIKECTNRSDEMIAGFFKDYFWLSNFYPSKVYYGGHEFLSVENAYQFAKHILEDITPEIISYFQTCTPAEAKKAGSKIRLRKDWNTYKVEVMEKLLTDKFYNIELRKRLLDTGDKKLVELNYWNDTFWGVEFDKKKKFKGKSMLGNLLMKIRQHIRNQIEALAYFKSLGKSYHGFFNDKLDDRAPEAMILHKKEGWEDSETWDFCNSIIDWILPRLKCCVEIYKDNNLEQDYYKKLSELYWLIKQYKTDKISGYPVEKQIWIRYDKDPKYKKRIEEAQKLLPLLFTLWW